MKKTPTQNKNEIQAQQKSPNKTGGKDSLPCFDVEKLGLEFCPAAEAEQICKEDVLRVLRLRAIAAGKQLRGITEGMIGPERFDDVRWLWNMLNHMRHEYAELINEKLEKLKELGAEREDLVAKIYCDILSIRATHTIFFGDEDLHRASSQPRRGSSSQSDNRADRGLSAR